MHYTLYSTPFASYLIAGNKLLGVEKAKDLNAQTRLLQEGKYTDTEEKLLRQHKGPVVYLGYKQQQKQNVAVKQERILLEEITKVLRQNTVLPHLREYSILLAKNAVRQSFRHDILVLQAINNIKELDKIINMLVKRIREWYGYYLPEFAVENNEKYVELILTRDKTSLLKELHLKEEASMGVQLHKQDLDEVKLIGQQVQKLFVLRKEHEAYLEKLMKQVAPNVQAVAGTTIGAQLIAIAGSLERLSRFPASTVQILGAEKALFRHMKTGAKPPKYGVLHEHLLVSQSNHKGKAARRLADKLSIAAKVDYFKGRFIGDKLRKELEQHMPKKRSVRA